jgi:hypothetical protein
MKTYTSDRAFIPPVIPVDDETRRMLEYATSATGRTKLEQARQEVRDGKIISVTPAYFDEMNRRVTKRVAAIHAGRAS